MKKQIGKKVLTAALVVGGVAVLASTLSSCNDEDVFHIYCWNDEFEGFFNKYVSDEKNNDNPEETHHLDGKVVKWTRQVSDGGKYQQDLDVALKNNANAKKSDKVDMFLAEADYILKYTDTTVTKDVKQIGVTDFSKTYKYTVDAASDSKGVVKGVSFQCCPAGLIYRRSIAKALFGTDDPAKVQEKVSDWSKFDTVAAQAKEKGYLITASYADTYRVFSNNADSAWVDAEGNVKMPEVVKTWMTQAETYVKNGYTKTDGLWDAGKTAEFKNDGKAFCTFGPAWYYNFSMGTAMGSGTASSAPKKTDDGNSWGDWAVIQGPQSFFWGGTWMLAATGGDDDELVAKTMNAFLNNDEICEKLVKDEGQFSNNKTVNEKVANEYEAAKKGNLFLGGQNDTKIWVDMADSIKFQNNTIYDQQCNEGLQTAYVKYLKKELSTKDEAIKDFYSSLRTAFPNLKVPQ